MKLSDDEKWEATVNADPIYDKEFYIAVKTTGVFCKTVCPSKMPLRKNVTFFDTREEAVTAGFRPCKRCRPDLV